MKNTIRVILIPFTLTLTSLYIQLLLASRVSDRIENMTFADISLKSKVISAYENEMNNSKHLTILLASISLLTLLVLLLFKKKIVWKITGKDIYIILALCSAFFVAISWTGILFSSFLTSNLIYALFLLKPIALAKKFNVDKTNHLIFLDICAIVIFHIVVAFLAFTVWADTAFHQ